MKKALGVLVMLFALNANAQILLKVNGKLIADKQEVKADSIKSVEVGFTNPKAVKSIGQGKAVLMISLNRTEDNYNVETYVISKVGENAVSAFLSEVNTFYTLYDEGGKKNQFSVQTDFWDEGNSLMKTLRNEASIDVRAKMKLEISLYFKDKIGYNQYGDAVDLVKVFTMNIDDSSYMKPKTQKKSTDDPSINTNTGTTPAPGMQTEEEKKAAAEKKKKEEMRNDAKKVLRKVF